MKAKEFIPAGKPRNFVAKNAPTTGAGKHKDSSKKKDQEQGKVKHKKDLVPMEARDPEDWDEGNTEPPNNFAIYINGKKWKVFKGRGQFADDYKERDQFRQLQNLAQAKSQSTGKEWKVYVTGEPATENIAEKAPPGFKGTVKAMKKHKDIDNPFALAWSMKNKGFKSHKKADGSDK
jgi:hypothetical protein